MASAAAGAPVRHGSDARARPPSRRRPSAPRTRPAPRHALRPPGWPAASPRSFGGASSSDVAASTGGVRALPRIAAPLSTPLTDPPRARARLARCAGTSGTMSWPGARRERAVVRAVQEQSAGAMLERYPGLLGRGDGNGHLFPVQSMCGTSAEVVWLPIAFSPDVHMSVEQALRARCCAGCKLPKGGYITL